MNSQSNLLRRAAKALGAAILAASALAVLLLYTWAPGRIMTHLNRTLQPGPYAVAPEAAAAHARMHVADLHSDALLWNRDILQRDTRGHTDVPRLLEGNVAVQGFTAATRLPAGLNIEANPDRWDMQVPLSVFQAWPASTWLSAKHRALYQARKLEKAAAASAGVLTLLRTREDLADYLARREGNPAITAGFLGIEGLHCLEADLENVRVMFDAGYRMMAPTHFFDNALGGSAHGMQKMGLTEFGRAVIEAMEQLQIIVDLAHASPRMIDDILAMATRPVFISHTGVRGTCDNNRNLTDAQLQAIAATGGLIGIGFWDVAVCGDDVASIVRAIRHTADLVGVDHVALGSDFDGATHTPFDSSGMALLTEGLLRDGFTEEETGRIMGGNVIRLLSRLLPSRNDPVPDLG
jgi:microsomal dipeptidase-like Zn-dependent dipeptidase